LSGSRIRGGNRQAPERWADKEKRAWGRGGGGGASQGGGREIRKNRRKKKGRIGFLAKGGKTVKGEMYPEIKKGVMGGEPLKQVTKGQGKKTSCQKRGGGGGYESEPVYSFGGNVDFKIEREVWDPAISKANILTNTPAL